MSSRATRQRETRRSSSAPLRRFVIQGPYSRPSPSCIQFGRPVGAWRITAIVKIRPQAAGSFISCARAASAGSTATRFIENNARYVEYCGAGECVGLYYTCINSYLTPESPAWGDVVRGTPPSREPSSQKTLRRREVDSNFQYAGTGESRHPAFVLPDCLGRVGACPGAAGFL